MTLVVHQEPSPLATMRHNLHRRNQCYSLNYDQGHQGEESSRLCLLLRQVAQTNSVVLPGLASLIAVVWPHLWATTCSGCRHHRPEQVAQPDQVVGDHMQAKDSTHLLDATARVNRLGVTLVAGRAAIDR